MFIEADVHGAKFGPRRAAGPGDQADLPLAARSA
jgi:hypothetical protein